MLYVSVYRLQLAFDTHFNIHPLFAREHYNHCHMKLWIKQCNGFILILLMCFNDLSLKKPIQLKNTVLKSKIRGDPCYCGFTIELQHRMGIMEDLIWTSNAPTPLIKYRQNQNQHLFPIQTVSWFLVFWSR